MLRRVFFSFHFDGDCQRAAQVRNIGSLDGNSPMRGNDWEALKSRGDSAVENWIAEQLTGRSCTIVLVGAGTANRKWINHEIVETWNERKGIVGVRIHGLKNLAGFTAPRGGNPFSFQSLTSSRIPLSSVVKLYDPTVTSNSKATYDTIVRNIDDWIEEAIEIRGRN
jgi:hypothetical protein